MRALLIVAQDLIRLVDLLELFLRLLIAGVLIRMIFHGKLAVRRTDLIRAGFAFHAKDLVVIFIVHDGIFIPARALSQAPKGCTYITLTCWQYGTFDKIHFKKRR